MGFRRKRATVTALANAGYETSDNELLVPAALATKLGATRGRKERYHTVGGDTELTVFEDVRVKVLAGDRTTKVQQARLVVSPHEDEVIMNDKLVESLGIQFVAVGRGLWRFKDDRAAMERPSLPRELW